MLPLPLIESIAAILYDAGDPTPIQRTRSIGGGCINNALRLETGRQSYLLKWNDQPLPDIFLVEAQGLALLQATATVRVPAVLHAANASAQRPAYILLEWLEGRTNPSSAAAQEMLGHRLADMHRASAPAYGLDHDNYLGSVQQHNGWYTDWVSFYRERRLRPQIELAEHNGYMHTRRRQKLERVLERLEDWLAGVERQPALLHGDLWSGNVIAGPGGMPALIDPAAYYGDREAELAYTELFGGFSSHFYRAYEETWTTAPDRDDRRDLYNLYHLLNHVNHFGESYGPHLDAVLQRYAD